MINTPGSTLSLSCNNKVIDQDIQGDKIAFGLNEDLSKRVISNYDMCKMWSYKVIYLYHLLSFNESDIDFYI